MINKITIGNSYIAEVIEVSNYGCIVKLIPSDRVGYISASKFLKTQSDGLKGFVRIGDHLQVTVTDVDEKQRVDLDLVID